MRLWPILALCGPLLFVSVAIAGQTFPYKAYVTADEVYVRSGPGQNYYPTDKLKTGQQVEVYRHDPGGWFAVRPPEGSFTWVSGRYLQWASGLPQVPGIATVRGENVAARVGSRFSDIRDVIQIRLNDLEPVEVIEKQDSVDGSGVWYKIAPPSGEFRWVFGKFLDPDYPVDGLRKPRSSDNAVSQAEPPVNQAAEPSTRPVVARTDVWQTVSASESRPAAATPQTPTPATAAPADDVARQATPPGSPVAVVEEPSREAYVPRTLSPEDFQAEIERIDTALSVMVAEEPTVWQFSQLEQRGEILLNQAETALERGRARSLLSKMSRFEDIKRRYDHVNLLRDETEQTNGQLAALVPKDADGRPEQDPEGQFDGVGQLTRVVSPKLGSPQYALVDSSGKIRCYVSSAPGVNLRYYVGSQVGINGTRGYMPEQRAQHVMAQHITTLDSPRLR